MTVLHRTTAPRRSNTRIEKGSAAWSRRLLNLRGGKRKALFRVEGAGCQTRNHIFSIFKGRIWEDFGGHIWNSRRFSGHIWTKCDSKSPDSHRGKQNNRMWDAKHMSKNGEEFWEDFEKILTRIWNDFGGHIWTKCESKSPDSHRGKQKTRMWDAKHVSKNGE